MIMKDSTSFKRNLLLCMTLGLVTYGCGGGSSKPETPVTPTPITPVPVIPTPASTIEAQFSLWLTDLSNNVILPKYQTLHSSAKNFSEESQLFCQLNSTSKADLDNLTASWMVLNLDWQRIQWLKIGPVIDHNRNLRVQLWPNRSGTVGQNVENLLLNQSVLNAAAVAKTSVSGQGIPALEYLLFPKSNQESLLNASNKDKRCEVVMAIGGNIVNIINEVYQEWSPTGGNYVQTVIEGTGEFMQLGVPSVKDAVEEIVTNWLGQIEHVKDEKMLKPLGEVAPGFVQIIEFELSDASIKSLQANVHSFEEIYSAGNGHGFNNILTDFLQQEGIATQMNEKIGAAIIAVDALSGHYSELLKSVEGRITIAEAIQKLRELRDLLTADFVQATDINIGFNSNDGD
ncbi:MAG: putative lipoprotein [Alteromonadaceae bacterium]|jgi:predicted lipoprotein